MTIHVMPNLKSFEIVQCPSLVVLPHRLFHKASSIQKLTITDDEGRPLKSSSSSFEAVFGTLVTAILTLDFFVIHEFVEPKLPSWITSLNYLTRLILTDSKNVISLPPLGKLPCLIYLSISKFSVLKLLGRELLGIEDDNSQKNTISTSITSFPKLSVMEIRNCEKLEVWEDIKPEEDVDEASTHMPVLRSLDIHDCPKLEMLPHRLLRQASSLRELEIRRCGILREKIVENTELLSRVKTIMLNDEILKPKSERQDTSGNLERSPNTSMRCFGRRRKA